MLFFFMFFSPVKYERIKFLVIALKSSVEVYAWAPKPYHKFMAFKVTTSRALNSGLSHARYDHAPGNRRKNPQQLKLINYKQCANTVCNCILRAAISHAISLAVCFPSPWSGRRESSVLGGHFDPCANVVTGIDRATPPPFKKQTLTFYLKSWICINI